jgi:hypothetical protein
MMVTERFPPWMARMRGVRTTWRAYCHACEWQGTELSGVGAVPKARAELSAHVQSTNCDAKDRCSYCPDCEKKSVYLAPPTRGRKRYACRHCSFGFSVPTQSDNDRAEEQRWMEVRRRKRNE